MQEFIWDVVSLNIVVDLVLIIAVITEGLKNLSDSQMRKPYRNLFRRNAPSPSQNDCPHWRSRPFDHGLLYCRVHILEYTPILTCRKES